MCVYVCVYVPLSAPGGQGAQRAHGHGILGRRPADVLKGHRKWALDADHVVGHQQGQRRRHAKVRQEADEEGRHDAQRDGLLGVLDLLSWEDTFQGSDGINRLVGSILCVVVY